MLEWPYPAIPGGSRSGCLQACLCRMPGWLYRVSSWRISMRGLVRPKKDCGPYSMLFGMRRARRECRQVVLGERYDALDKLRLVVDRAFLRQSHGPNNSCNCTVTNLLAARSG